MPSFLCCLRFGTSEVTSCRTFLAFAVEPSKAPQLELRYPGKGARRGHRLIVSDGDCTRSSSERTSSAGNRVAAGMNLHSILRNSRRSQTRNVTLASRCWNERSIASYGLWWWRSIILHGTEIEYRYKANQSLP